MSKFVVLGLLAVGGVILLTGDAEARGRRRCCGANYGCAASACAAPVCAMSDCGTSACGTSACGASGCGATGCGTSGCGASGCSASIDAAPAPVVAGTTGSNAMTQASNGAAYQSFSYEPGSSQTGTPAAPVYSTPVTAYRGYSTQASGNSIYNSVLRGDRKMRGLSN